MRVSYATLGIKLSSIIAAASNLNNTASKGPALKGPASNLNHTNFAATTTSNGSSAASKQLNGGWFDVQLKTISQTVQETEKNSEKNGMIGNGKVIMVQNEVQ